MKKLFEAQNTYEYDPEKRKYDNSCMCDGYTATKTEDKSCYKTQLQNAGFKSILSSCSIAQQLQLPAWVMSRQLPGSALPASANLGMVSLRLLRPKPLSPFGSPGVFSISLQIHPLCQLTKDIYVWQKLPCLVLFINNIIIFSHVHSSFKHRCNFVEAIVSLFCSFNRSR